MLWHQQQPIAKSIFLNFQNLIAECIQHTQPDQDYFFEQHGDDFYYATQIPFPIMNGIISNEYRAIGIDAKCKILKDKFKSVNYPITWFWPHDMDLPKEVENVFAAHGFSSMGKFTSIAVEVNKIKNLPIQFDAGVTIDVVATEEQFIAFLQITQQVFGLANDALSAMARLYNAYKFSNNMKLYLASVDKKPVSTLFSYQYQNTFGLHNGATLEAYRKRGLLTALIIQAVKDASAIEHVVAVLMAEQMAKGVCDNLGFQTYAHCIPLCYGFDLNQIHM